MELLDAHLDRVSLEMGCFLRGFEDAAIHVGSSALFVQQFRQVLEIPALRDPDGEEPLSYVEAVQHCMAPVVQTLSQDPITVLTRGLGGPATMATQPRRELRADAVWEDLAKLLRVPVLRFYMHVPDRRQFLSRLEEIAERGRFPLAYGGQEPAQDTFERFVELPMVSAVRAVISYDMLRETVALDLVETYQEETRISPIESGL